MKKPIIILSVIFIIVVIAISAVMIFSDFVIEREDIESKYRLYKDDFQKASDYVIKEIADNDEISIVVSWDYENNTPISLYSCGKEYYPGEKVKSSLENISKAFSGYDFSYIDVTSERISYYGMGEIMFVYSRNGKAPKYFYSSDDGANFNVYKLWDGWYFLKLSWI